MSKPISEIFFVANLLIYKMENNLPGFASVDEVNNYSSAVCKNCNKQFKLNAWVLSHGGLGDNLDCDRFIKYSPNALGYIPLVDSETLRKNFRAPLSYEILKSMINIENQMINKNKNVSDINVESHEL